MLAHIEFLCSGPPTPEEFKNLCSNLRCAFHMFLNSFPHGTFFSLFFFSPSPQLTIHWLNGGGESNTRNMARGGNSLQDRAGVRVLIASQE